MECVFAMKASLGKIAWSQIASTTVWDAAAALIVSASALNPGPASTAPSSSARMIATTADDATTGPVIVTKASQERTAGRSFV